MWLGLHVFYLLGNRHRLSMLLHWAFSFVSHRRTDRVVTERQGLARQAQLSLPVAGQPAAESTAPAESARRRRRGLRRWSDESGRCGGELRCGESAP